MLPVLVAWPMSYFPIKFCRVYDAVKFLFQLIIIFQAGLAQATGVHERNTVRYARFAVKKRHGFCAKAREKNMQRHRLGTL